MYNKDYFLEIQSKIAEIWDSNIAIRATDIENKTDSSYIEIIVPYIMDKINKYTSNTMSIIDIGCGCGYLTNCIFQEGMQNIIGIDISNKSIKYAKQKYPKIDFACTNFFHLPTEKKYNVGLAVMTVNNMPCIQNFFETISLILDEKGVLLLVLPHPCFWPLKHVNFDNYNYSKNEKYEIPFYTKGRTDYSANIIYFHRSVEYYLKQINDYNFKIESFDELYEKNSSSPDILAIVISKKD